MKRKEGNGPGSGGASPGATPRTRALRSTTGPVALFGALLAGCAGDGGDRAGGWQAVVDTVADTVVVRTVAGSVWGDTARLEEEVRIGALEGAEAYLLGEPASLAVRPDGVVYVLDTQVPVVRAYGSDGRHLRDLGREGAGPGEYRSPDGVAVLPDGRVLVRDPRNMRINVYARSGEWLDTWDHPNRGAFHTYQRFYVDTAGRSWVTAVEGGVPWEWEYMIIGVSPGGEIVDTLRAPSFAFEPAQLTAAGPRSSSVRRVPFTADDAWSYSPLGYIVGGVTGTYAIYLFRPGGPVLRIEREADPVAVSPEEAGERKERITRGLQRQYGAWRWNGPDVPASKPPWRGVSVDDDGRIWVLVSRPGEPTLTEGEAAAIEERTGDRPLRFQEPPAFDVFDADGRFLGPVAVPPGFRASEPPPVARGDRVWAVVEDDAGIPYVVRYRLVTNRGSG